MPASYGPPLATVEEATLCGRIGCMSGETYRQSSCFEREDWITQFVNAAVFRTSVGRSEVVEAARIAWASHSSHEPHALGRDWAISRSLAGMPEFAAGLT